MEKKSKVLIVFLGKIEAGPVFTLGFTEGLIENGVDTFVVLHEEIENKEEWIQNIPKDHLFFLRYTPKKRNLFPSTFLFFKELKELRKKFADQQFSCSISTFINPFDFFISRAVGCRRIITVCHDPIAHSSEPIFKTIRTEYLMRQSDELIVLTKQFVDIVHQKYKKAYDNIYYVRHGLMSYPSLSLSNKEKKKNKVNFIFFGRIDSYKGLNILSEAYRNLSNKYSGISLTIAGNGDFSSYEKGFSNDNSINVINRYIREDEVPELFGKYHTVAIIPYTEATQSGVIPIAFFYGVPIIVSKIDSLYEQLYFGKYGVFFENRSAKSLYDCMERFVIDENFYQAQSDSMIKGKDDFKWKTTLEDFVKGLSFNE